MTTVKLMLDYMAGPIWGNHIELGTHKRLTDIPAIDDDPRIQELNEEIQMGYFDCYEFDVDDQPCVFKPENTDWKQMLAWMKELRARIDAHNDGSFRVEDYATPEIQQMADQE